MSSGQKPRTPQYYPQMKVRGAKRRQQAPWQQLAGGFVRLGVATVTLAVNTAPFVEAVERMRQDAD